MLRVSGIETPSVDFVLPSWIPGSYMIQDQAKLIRSVEARPSGAGGSVPVERIDKARWRVATPEGGAVEFRFEAYAHSLLTDGVDLTHEHLWLNPGMCLPYVDGHKDAPSDLVLDLPSGWKVFTELKETGRSPPRYRANSYDELVDSPLDCGFPAELSTRARGATHRIILCGHGGNFEAHRLEEDVRRLSEATIGLFGDASPDPYTYFIHLAETRDGGLEHRTSNACVIERNAFQPGNSYRQVLGLLCHEYIHRYLVKAIRPRVLGPFDYEREVYTRFLWLMEGTTDYYAYLLLRRADLVPTKVYLRKWLERVAEYLQIPGRHFRSLESASMLAWIDYYRRFEDSPNVSVSYYVKGSLVSFALDLELRRRTDNRRSLDDVMQYLWTAYGRPGRGLEEGEFPEIVARATEVDIQDFYRRYVAGTDELDFAATFGYAGLGFKPKEASGEGEEDEPSGYLGVRISTEGSRVRIQSVLEGGPAHRAGLAPGAEIVAIDGVRVDPARFDQWLQRYPPGQTVDIAFFDRAWLTHASVTLGTPPPKSFLTPAVDAPTALQRAIYESWLADKWPAASKDGSPSPG